jgi:hypothetical protein
MDLNSSISSFIYFFPSKSFKKSQLGLVQKTIRNTNY